MKYVLLNMLALSTTLSAMHTPDALEQVKAIAKELLKHPAEENKYLRVPPNSPVSPRTHHNTKELRDLNKARTLLQSRACSREEARRQKAAAETAEAKKN